VRFQVLSAAIIKMTAFWDIAPCSLVEVDGPEDGAVYTFETSVNFYETIRRNITEGCHLNEIHINKMLCVWHSNLYFFIIILHRSMNPNEPLVIKLNYSVLLQVVIPFIQIK
jgi:hypothetical protein